MINDIRLPRTNLKKFYLEEVVLHAIIEEPYMKYLKMNVRVSYVSKEETK